MSKQLQQKLSYQYKTLDKAMAMQFETSSIIHHSNKAY